MTGESIISIYAPESPSIVYSQDAWWSDRWDAVEYGRDFDFNRPFFDQFRELQLAVPRIALHAVQNQNAEYVNMTAYSKDCYLLFGADYCENCHYGRQVIKSESCLDGLNCLESQHCYEVTDVEKSYGLFFSQNCSNCSDSLFLYDCRGCRDCLLCTNLRSKQYCVLNQQCTKEEYEKKKEEILAAIRHGKLAALRSQFAAMVEKGVHRFAEITNCENVTGDYLANSHNLHECYELSYADDCCYVASGFQLKDIGDYNHATEAELGYECMSVGFNSYNCSFSTGSWSSKNCSYNDVVHSCSECFGCIGLRNKQYCILNKQYLKEEYEKFMPKIIEHMQRAGEFGEFFPISMSPFAYNETMAQEYFPLTREEAMASNWQWREQQDPEQAVTKMVDGAQLPSDITQVTNDILQWAVRCAATGRLFRIVKPELEFYRLHGLAVPRFHPDERHRQRMVTRNPRRLWDSTCSKCGKPIRTSYDPQRKLLALCDDCYRKEVY